MHLVDQHVPLQARCGERRHEQYERPALIVPVVSKPPTFRLVIAVPSHKFIVADLFNRDAGGDIDPRERKRSWNSNAVQLGGFLE